MRVISGSARGRTLRVAANAPVRPTADLVKGAMFSILEAEAYKRGFEPDDEGTFPSALAWPRVLDLFAGSGALGIEALSRGARHATFVEQQADSIKSIESNLRSLDMADRATVVRGSVVAAVGRRREPVDVVFVDPPYADEAARNAALEALTSAGLLHDDSVVVLEQAWDTQPPAAVGTLPLRSTRRHSKTRITLYARPLRGD